MTTPPFRLLSLVVVLTGCGSTSHADLVPLPVAGMPVSFSGPAGTLEVAGGACRSPLRDPRGGVVLTLVRSGRERARPDIGWGDYAVAPAGSLGCGQINCCASSVAAASQRGSSSGDNDIQP